MRNLTLFMVLLAALIFGLAACGGGGSSSSNPPDNTVTVSGSVINGPLVGATVSIYAADGTLLGQALTDENGLYGLDGLPPSDSYRIVTGGGTLDGDLYPGDLSARCTELPCNITPLTTLIDQLSLQENISYSDAADQLFEWLALDTDPFMASHQGTPVAGVNMTVLRNGILDHAEDIDGWIHEVLEAFSNQTSPGETWLGIPMIDITTVTSLTTGRIWMDRNLGAARVAISINDAEAFGDLYQWGRGTDGHEKRDSGTTTELSLSDVPGHGDFIQPLSGPVYDWSNPSNDTRWTGTPNINNPCPSGFSVPTIEEWQAELTTLVDQASAFASPLKLISAGYRTYGHGGEIFSTDTGFYWSRSVNDDDARNLYISSGGNDVYSNPRAHGFSVRCVQDIQTVTSPTGQVWMDRNLGASRVATSFDDAEAFGDLYQWGRGTDGHEKRTSLTTTTLSSSDTPGHGDFIVAPNSPYDWRSPQNASLWQSESDGNNPCPSGFRIPTIAEWQAEITEFSITNIDSAFASPLKLVLAGSRDYFGGALGDEGSDGFYWSSSVNGSYTRSLHVNSAYAGLNGSYYRASGSSVRCLKDTFLPPADHVAVNFTINDTANRSYSNADGLAWKGSFSFDPVTRILTYAAAWPGPYPMMYDDGPWSSGGHEPLGSVAGDNIWGVTVWVPTTTTQSFEYGAIHGSTNGSDGTWIWIGPNGTFTVTSGSTVPINAPGLVIPGFD